MNDFSEQRLRQDCPHCQPDSFALSHPLRESSHFWIVCDVHPLTEGHVLIIPKLHLSCVGAYPPELFGEFVDVVDEFSEFVKKTYGRVSTFEHGRIGQTVFHSHVHLLPWKGKPEEIVPEGGEYLRDLKDISELKDIFALEGKYLYFSIENSLWTVKPSIGAPGFFRDRFSKALGHPERGNWKKMHADQQMMVVANQDIAKLEENWKAVGTGVKVGG